MKSRAALLTGLLGLSLMADGMDRPMFDAPNVRPARYSGNRNGHTSWSTNKPAKVKKWRAKSRRAKVARKLNWN